MKRILIFAAIGLALGGCGGGSDAGTPGSGTMEAGIDAFIGKVLNLLAGTADTSEPISVDAFAITAPEDAQPIPLM